VVVPPPKLLIDGDLREASDGACFPIGADRARARQVAARIRAGTIGINGGAWYSADVPFGGYKRSGNGREMGLRGFEEYLEIKSVAEPAGD